MSGGIGIKTKNVESAQSLLRNRTCALGCLTVKATNSKLTGDIRLFPRVLGP